MTPVQLDCSYSLQLDGMVKARAEKENLRHLALMARKTMKRRAGELSMPADGTRLWIWTDLHFDDERIRRHAKAPVPDHPHDDLDAPGPLAGDRRARRHGRVRRGPRRQTHRLRSLEAALRGPPRPEGGRSRQPRLHRFRWRERPLGANASVMTLVIHTDPPLLSNRSAGKNLLSTGSSSSGRESPPAKERLWKAGQRQHWCGRGERGGSTGGST